MKFADMIMKVYKSRIDTCKIIVGKYKLCGNRFRTEKYTERKLQWQSKKYITENGGDLR